MDIVAKSTKYAGEAAVIVDWPSDLEGLVAKFGAEAVASGFLDSAVIAVQNVIRKAKEQGKSDLEQQALADAWVPGRRDRSGAGIATQAKMFKQVIALKDDPEALAAFIESAQAAIAAAEKKAAEKKAAKATVEPAA